MVTPEHALVDMQVATGYAQVEAFRAAFDRQAAARAAHQRAARYAAWVRREFLTTTPAGREGRARASAREETTLQELAEAEAALPELASAAMRAAPEVMARMAVGQQAAREFRAAWSAEHGPVRF